MCWPGWCRLVGIERNLPAKAAKIAAQAEEVIKAVRADDEIQAAYRRVVIAAGDVKLWQGNGAGAAEFYGRAERLSANFIPAQVKAARVGAYPNAVREYIAGGNLGAALDLVDRWEQTFPTDKPKGHTFYWRGKVLAERGQPKEAVRSSTGRCGWRPATTSRRRRLALAEALAKLGRKEAARAELKKLVGTGLNDAFSRRAREKLKNWNSPRSHAERGNEGTRRCTMRFMPILVGVMLASLIVTAARRRSKPGARISSLTATLRPAAIRRPAGRRPMA